MLLVAGGGTREIIWIVLAALVVVRVGFGIWRHTHPKSEPSTATAPAPRPTADLRPVVAPSAPGSVVLEVRDLTVAYGPTVAVDGVTSTSWVGRLAPCRRAA